MANQDYRTKRKTPNFTVKVQVRSFSELKNPEKECYQKLRLDDENFLWIPLTGYSIEKLKKRISVRSWAKFLTKYKQGAKDYLFTFKKIEK